MTSSATQYTLTESPVSPTASFYDLSDDEEGEYNTIMHSHSGRGVKLLFSKSKVRGRCASTLAGLIIHRDLGLRTPNAIIQRQRSRIHCSDSAETIT